MRPIFLLTDFGHRDHYVGVMKAVIASIAPAARIFDLCHEVPPQDLRAGAYLLGSSWAHLPEDAIVVGVVDPGVGGPRRAIALSNQGRLLVGPDNGLLNALATPTERAVHLTNTEHHARTSSATFHGRDIFSPVAAHLALGVELGALGEALDVGALVAPALSPPRVTRLGLEATIVHVDHFGNLITNVVPEALEEGWSGAMPDGRAFFGVETFSEAPADGALAYLGSGGHVEIAVRNGSAALSFGIGRGVRVLVRGARMAGAATTS